MYSELGATRRRLAGSYFISMMSIMLVLFVLGLFASIMMLAGNFSDYLRENIGFEVMMRKGVSENNILKLKKEIETKEFVKSTEYISQQEATRRLTEELGEDFLKWLGNMENPLSPSIDIRVKAEYANNDSLAKIEKWLMNKTGVKEVSYQKSLVGSLNNNIKKIGVVLFGIGIILLIMAITLISHAVRLSIYAKRFTVRSMQLVGATRGFIRKPFMQTFVIQGFIGSLLAVALLTLLMYAGVSRYPELVMMQDMRSMAVVFGGVIMTGVLLTAGATYFIR